MYVNHSKNMIARIDINHCLYQDWDGFYALQEGSSIKMRGAILEKLIVAENPNLLQYFNIDTTCRSLKRILPQRGQGVISVIPDDLSKLKEPCMFFKLANNNQENSRFLILEVTRYKVSFYIVDSEQGKYVFIEKEANQSKLGIDTTSDYCPYWFSIDSNNCILSYGKGEVREETSLINIEYISLLNMENKQWIKSLRYYEVSSPFTFINVNHFHEAVTKHPMLIFSKHELTMDRIARGEGMSSKNLSKECQKLYATVAGNNFVIDTPDFPDFTKAIERSIDNENGWCFKKLIEKGGFRGAKATYLRITLGRSEGMSPGVPYVMEVWPKDHYSTIHNHAGAHAIIKVLHGEVSVELFRCLSTNNQEPFTRTVFKKGQITWITPELNQTHRLMNDTRQGHCITIQCYLYPDKDSLHYEFFDYIDGEGKKICQFIPVSDMDFMKFKDIMKREWEQHCCERTDNIEISLSRNSSFSEYEVITSTSPIITGLTSKYIPRSVSRRDGLNTLFDTELPAIHHLTIEDQEADIKQSDLQTEYKIAANKSRPKP